MEFPKNQVPRKGEMLSFGDDGGWSGTNPKSANGARDNYFGLGVNTGLTLTGGASFSISLSGLYGWNTGGMEFHPELEIGYANDFSFGIGGDLDINFTENKAGNDFIPAFTLGANFRRAGGNIISFNAGLAGKWFPFKTAPTAIRLALGYNGTVAGGSMSHSITILSAGVQTYF